MARNALLGLALLGALTLAGCSGSGQQDQAKAAQAQLAALRARTDSLRQHAQAVRHDTAAALAATTTLGTPRRDSSRAQGKPVAGPATDSIARMDDAEAAGRAIEVGSNFFLFFSSEHSSMSGMTK